LINNEYLKYNKKNKADNESVLNDSKILLKLTTLSIIQLLRSNPELYNFISYSNSVETTYTTYGTSYLLLMSSGRQQSFNDTYTALILEEAEELYNELTKELTNRVIAAATAIR
jgi:hypothetical protein